MNYQFKVMTGILGVVVAFWLATSAFFIYQFYKSHRANNVRRSRSRTRSTGPRGRDRDQEEGIELRPAGSFTRPRLNSVAIQDEFVFFADNYRRRQQMAQQRAQQRAQMQHQEVGQGEQGPQAQEVQQNQENHQGQQAQAETRDS